MSDTVDLPDDKSLREILSLAGNGNIVSVASVKNLPADAQKLGILPNHAYAVFSVNTKAGTVTLRNPHNRPDRIGGVEVTMSIANLRKWFVQIAYSKI
jgi:hypothetical protein